MNKFLLVFSLLISYCIVNSGFSASLQKLDNTTVNLAVGSYVELGPVTRPMLLTSNDDAQTWFFNNGVLANNSVPIDVTCSSNVCTLVSEVTVKYTNKQYTNVYKSQDYGQSWTNLNITPGLIYSVDCTATLCVAVGSHKNSDEDIPMITLSDDNGNTWSRIKNIKDLPATFTGNLNKVTCSNNFCAAVGQSDHDLLLPMFIVSSDNNKTWTFVKNISGLPSNIDYVESMEHIKCVKNTCVAAGTYSVDDHIHPLNSHVLLIVSHDSGKSWHFINEIPAISNMTFLYIEDLIISNGSFIVVGGYGKDTGLPQALILVSDDGDTWTLIDKIAGTHKKMGWLKSVSCVAGTCFTTGSTYYSGGIGFGLTLLTSKDNGKSWALIPYTPNIPYAADFDAIQCAGTTCIAMGTWVDGGDYSHVVFLISKDTGQSWTTETNNISNFPQYIFEIHFMSIHQS